MTRPNVILITIFAMALSACQSAVPTQQGQASNVAPSAQPPVVQASGDLCANPFWPVVEGANWTSNLHTDQGDMTQVDTITDVGSDAFLVDTTQGQSTNYIITWTCTPEGLLWLQTDGGQFAAVFPDAQWATNSYSGVSIPKQIQPGDSWASSESLTATSSQGSFDFNVNIDFHAMGVESVTVPAGTFNAMRVDLVMVFSGQVSGQDFETTYNISDWVAEGVGLVRSVATSDVGGADYSLELASYSIP